MSGNSPSSDMVGNTIIGSLILLITAMFLTWFIVRPDKAYKEEYSCPPGSKLIIGRGTGWFCAIQPIKKTK